MINVNKKSYILFALVITYFFTDCIVAIESMAAKFLQCNSCEMGKIITVIHITDLQSYKVRFTALT